MKKVIIKSQLILWVIILLAGVLRLMSLSKIPTGFVPEEVSSGWNAYSILHTARDEWGNFLPLVFKETGGYKLALFSYLIVPFIKLLGLNEFAVRLPTALFSILSIYLVYELSLILFGKRKIALFSALLLAINPWHMAVGRYGEDVNIGIALFLLATIFFLKSLKKPKLLILSGLCYGLTFYTYASYAGFTSFFIIFLVFWKRKWLWINRKLAVIFIIIPILMLIPYIQANNLTTRFNQVGEVGQIGSINKINEHRGACEVYNSAVYCRIIYNKFTNKAIEIGKNYLNHFSTTVYFLSGSKLGLSGMPDDWGLLYLFEFPLIILGLYYLVSRKQMPVLVLAWILLSLIPSSMVADSHIWRMMVVLPEPQILGAVGMVYLLQLNKGRIWRWLIRVTLILVVAFSLLTFLTDYFSYFPYIQGRNNYFGFRDTYQYLKTQENNVPQIVIAPSGMGFEQQYIYYLFYLHPDPKKYQQGIDVDRYFDNKGWAKITRIGKWRFINDYRDNLLDYPDGTLIVVDGNTTSYKILPYTNMSIELIKSINYPYGDPAFQILKFHLFGKPALKGK